MSQGNDQSQCFSQPETKKNEAKQRTGYTYAQDTLGPYQFDLLIRNGTFCVALPIGLEIAQIAYVALTIGWGSVGFGEGVDWVREGGGSQPCFLALGSSHMEAFYGKRGRWHMMLWNVQCGPALVQPLVLSPNWCTCMPRFAEASLPVML